MSRLRSSSCAVDLTHLSRAAESESEEVDELESGDEAPPAKKVKAIFPVQGALLRLCFPAFLLTPLLVPDEPDSEDESEDDVPAVRRPPILPPKVVLADGSVVAAIERMLPEEEDSDDEAPPAKKPRGRPPKSASKTCQSSLSSSSPQP